MNNGQIRQMDGNQVVALNLAQARALRGWTQAEAAERAEPHLGERWSVSSWSAAERAAEGHRHREFTANEIAAFAKAFDLPISWFFLPPAGPSPRGGISSERTAMRVGESALDVLDALRLNFPPDTDELIREVGTRADLQLSVEGSTTADRQRAAANVIRDFVIQLVHSLSELYATGSNWEMARKLNSAVGIEHKLYVMSGEEPPEPAPPEWDTEAFRRRAEGKYGPQPRPASDTEEGGGQS